MNSRLRKLLGTMIFVAGTAGYFLFAISIALARLPGTSISTQLLFYLATTLIWLLPAALLICWMQRPSGSPPTKRQ